METPHFGVGNFAPNPKKDLIHQGQGCTGEKEVDNDEAAGVRWNRKMAFTAHQMWDIQGSS